MTKLDIFNIALKQHGKMCTQTDMEASNKPYEVSLCETYYRGAVLRVLGECDWSFLTTKVVIEKEFDFPEGGWKHGFLLPQGIFKIIFRSEEPYEVIRNKFLTDCDNPQVYCIMDTFDPDLARDDFCNLVGLALAYELCGLLAPNNSNIMSMIMNNYSWLLQGMINTQSNSQIRTVEEGGSALKEYR